MLLTSERDNWLTKLYVAHEWKGKLINKTLCCSRVKARLESLVHAKSSSVASLNLETSEFTQFTVLCSWNWEKNMFLVTIFNCVTNPIAIWTLFEIRTFYQDIPLILNHYWINFTIQSSPPIVKEIFLTAKVDAYLHKSLINL